MAAAISSMAINTEIFITTVTTTTTVTL
jgi:hypothetical protein